jgi:signal peptidase I
VTEEAEPPKKKKKKRKKAIASETSEARQPPKSQTTAFVASLVVPGLGHFYLGALRRGAVFLAVNTLLPIVVGTALGEVSRGVMLAALLVCIGVTRIAAAADTYLVPAEQQRTLGTGTMVLLVIGGLVLAQGALFALRSQVMEAYKIPAGSMMPTLLVGDHVFVDKSVYRHRDPRRGELVVFRYPEHPEQDFVKRAVGVGGDKIVVRGDTLTINGWSVPKCRVGAWSYGEADGTSHKGTLFVEYLDDAMYYVFFDEQALAATEQGPYYVKPGETFVMGDNRNNSHDSRMWFGGTGGNVPRDHVKGSPRLLWMSSVEGRLLADLGELGAPPSSDLTADVKRCVAERPPRAKTSPPPLPGADR